MKRSTAFVLTVGYLLLVPYCFFGASVFSPAILHSSGTPTMNGHVMSTDACTGCGVPSADADHTGMYLSVTSVTGTPLLSLLLSLTALFVAFIFVARYRTLVPTLVRIPIDARKDRRRSRASARHDLLSWLSLTETSPTFA
ncbi:MAG: hypothetical protein A3C93_02450 [Candidatus Lloydbacteria bacterium RIFCSPHIGHO2_02_FULL_54_17]|uniref:Uncharacterized protein n=1 Tax=Candidatus Lloydbacteria bacterium RIFCSPHIGHO2_02_FULL_54_17 TaxID=1798664 RepID=A0A1G2DFP1_9BACT|nr:MAG: hypothetical protein A3C93_02450 [Candidatus Lloydbacteria bacterium RIFCSPHIGHO2_02_FULL_54_17]OGZ14300.1 MAG: hypothetical protein A2948_01785 [Candidatus Lloydbacteria bacterium RIFCSPLOWO2_01_FULL_54_18]OGZ16032.1 MAG: hypothetical protein A3H76_00695 [Candidatus Lloydbacteria bacterium RIFCSPLOWO2_02_FULL_54_12]